MWHDIFNNFAPYVQNFWPGGGWYRSLPFWR